MSRNIGALVALEGLRTTLARLGAAGVLKDVEARNAGEPVVPTAIAYITAARPETSPPPAAFDQGRAEPLPTTNNMRPSVDPPARRAAAPYRYRPEVRRRIAAWASMQALGNRMGAH